MRNTPPGGGSFSPSQAQNPVLTWLLLSNIAVFVLQHIFLKLFRSPFIETTFALSFPALRDLHIWSFISYGFLHGSLMHIGFNLLALFFVGRILEPLLGSRGFGFLYFGGVLIGGLTWLLVGTMAGSASPWGAPEQLMGASAGVMTLLAYFCILFPERPMTFLIFFIIPVTLKPKWILWFLIITEGFGMLNELSGQPGFLAVAHSAHMGGILAAYLLRQFNLENAPSWGSRSGISIETPGWFKRRRRPAAGKFKLNLINRNDLQREVDRILDKINQKGFGALTLQEKETLDRARDFLKH